MKKLTLSDLWLVLDNMVRLRLVAINMLAMGALYEKRLRGLHEKIGAIPGVRDRLRPLAADLAIEDAGHDAFGRAIDHLLAAYEALAEFLPAEINAAVKESRKHIIAGTGDLAIGYIDEATAAKRRRQVLATLDAALTLLPVAHFGSCKELAERYTVHGENIDAFIQKRADIETEAAKQHARLRFDGLSLLKDMQDGAALQLKNERSADVVNLPDNIQGRVFGYTYALLQLRTANNTDALPEDDVIVEPAPPEPTL